MANVDEIASQAGCPDDAVVQRFIEGKLVAEERATTEAHLAVCSECRRLVSQLARTGAAPAPPADVLAPGMVVGGRFVLERRLGGGGMGTVWAAQHQVTRERVALKLVRGVAGERERKRFLREARVAGAFSHPNIAVARDAFELDDGTPVLVMDLLVGRSLRERLRDGALPADEATRVLGAVAEVIAAAHAHGVVHRDLKPDNIFLCDAEPPRVKVLDFGIAKLHHDGASGDITRTGDLLGTPYYMAPEQLFGESDVDGSADVWALGVTACECVSGVRPFDGDGVGALLKAVAAGASPTLPALAKLPAPLGALVRRMLSAERRARPTMAEVAAALGAKTAPPPARRQHPRVALLGLALLLAAVLTIVGWRVMASRDAEVATAPPEPPASPAASNAPPPPLLVPVLGPASPAVIEPKRHRPATRAVTAPPPAPTPDAPAHAPGTIVDKAPF